MGWRKAHTVVRREGWVVNHKKLRRLWKEEGLRRPLPNKNKKRRPGGLDGTLLTAAIGIMCGDSISSSTKPLTCAC